MSTTTSCQVCGTATARHGCDRCGAMVCAEHYEEGRGTCSECARGGGRTL